MNVNVGKLYNGWPILDAATFRAKVTEPMKASGLPYAGAAGLGLPLRDPKGGFGIYKFNPTRNFPLDYASGASYDDSYIQASIAEQWGQLAVAIDNPNAIFEYDDADPAGKDVNKDRIRVFYYRTKDVVVPVGSKTYYQSSNWVGIRGGLIFVGGVIFSALGAPVLSSALTSAASGVAIDATVVTPTVATTVSTVANGEAQLFGDKNIALAGKVINLVNGQVGGSTASTLGASTVGDELDFGDYDPVDYSSGESWTAFSDGQNVDYGFEGQNAPDFSAVVDDESGITISDENYSHEGVNYNSTAESDVSDYGSVNQGNGDFSPEDAKALGAGAVKALPVAGALAKPNPTVQTQAPAISGGGTKYSQTAGSVASAIAQATATSQGSSPSLSGLSGLVQQIESVLPKNYAGQLGANKTAPQPLSSNNMLLIGAALIGVALLLHFKG